MTDPDREAGSRKALAQIGYPIKLMGMMNHSPLTTLTGKAASYERLQHPLQTQGSFPQDDAYDLGFYVPIGGHGKDSGA